MFATEAGNSKKDAIKIVVLLLRSRIRDTETPPLDNLAASLGEGANRTGEP